MSSLNLIFSDCVDNSTRGFYRELFQCYQLDSFDGSFKFDSNEKFRFDPLAIVKNKTSVKLLAYQDHPTESLETGITFTGEGKITEELWAYKTDTKIIKHKTPCLFLDRDGVIIKDTGYPSDPSQLVIIDEIIKVIKFANKLKIPVIVLTNQSGIARGKFSKEDFYKCTDWINNDLEKSEARIDKWFFSPYHIEGTIKELSVESLCRKPKAGMLLKSFGHYNVDLTTSLMIGDKSSDKLDMPGLEFFQNKKDEIKSYEIIEVLEKKWRNL